MNVLHLKSTFLKLLRRVMTGMEMNLIVYCVTDTICYNNAANFLLKYYISLINVPIKIDEKTLLSESRYKA